MRMLFCGYRTWAIDAYGELCKQEGVRTLHLASSPSAMSDHLASYDYDVIVLAGWSWIIPPAVCDENYIIGVHPSDLPSYAGGTPIQHQVLDGITESKATLFRITSKIDAGGILFKAPLSLEGNVTDIFSSLKDSTVLLLVRFLDAWQAHGGPPPETPQDSSKPARRRLKPAHSELTRHMLGNMTVRELYDFVRCREDPYPNAYVKDHTGTLRFRLVSFEGPSDD